MKWMISLLCLLLLLVACQEEHEVDPIDNLPTVQDEPEVVEPEPIVEEEVDEGPGIFDVSDEPEPEPEEVDILEITKPKGLDALRVNSILAKGSLFGGDYILNNLEFGMDGLESVDLENLIINIDQYQFNVDKIYNATLGCTARDVIVRKQFFAVTERDGMGIVCVATPTQMQQTGEITLTLTYLDREVFAETITMPPAIINQEYAIYGPDKAYE